MGRRFRAQMHDPPSPLGCCGLLGAWNYPGFFSEWPRFLPRIGSYRRCFRVPFVDWRCIHGWMYDPPPPFFGGVLGFLFVGGVSDSLNSYIFSYFFILLCTFFYLSRLCVCGGGSKASGSYLRGLVLRGFAPPCV